MKMHQKELYNTVTRKLDPTMTGYLTESNPNIFICFINNELNEKSPNKL